MKYLSGILFLLTLSLVLNAGLADVVAADDVTGPNIKNITLDKSGVLPGDRIIIDVEFEDESGILTNIQHKNYIYFRAEASNELHVSHASIPLFYDEYTGQLGGSFEIRTDLIPGKWNIESIVLFDKEGNRTEIQPSEDSELYRSFVINKDTTPPEAPVVYEQVTDKSWNIGGTAENGTTVKVSDGTKLIGSGNVRNGMFNVRISEQKAGTVLYVTVQDPSGNESPVTKVIVKDVTAPIITGVENHGLYFNDIRIEFNEGKATLNGEAFESGSTVSEHGAYELIVTDSFGNSTKLFFSIDKTPPFVHGVENQGVYYESVFINFNGDAIATLNGKTFTNGTRVDDIGQYELVVSDRHGKKNVINFTIAFKDVPKSNRFFNDIHHLINKSIISGYDDRTFRPDKVVTRGEAAIMLGRTLGLDGTKRNTNFTDVGKSSVASGYIQSAVDAGIIQGFEDGSYKPNTPVSRGQMAILLARAFELTKSEQLTFTDVHKGTAAYPYISKIVAAEITFGYSDATFRPYDSCTRGQFSAFLARALNMKNSQ